MQSKFELMVRDNGKFYAGLTPETQFVVRAVQENMIWYRGRIKPIF